MKKHKRYSESEELRLLALCNHGPRAFLLVEEDLTSDDKAVTCGNCRSAAKLPPLPKKKKPESSSS